MTSARLRESLIARIRDATGENWAHQVASIVGEIASCHEVGDLTTEDAVAVEAAIQDRHRRSDRARAGHQYRAGMAGQAAAIVEDLARAIEAGSLEPEPAQVEAARPTSVPIVPRKPRRIIPPDEAAKRALRRERRHTIAKMGRFPGRVAGPYSVAQQAVLSVIIREIVLHGACTLAVDSIAGFARVSRRVVQSARRLAQQRGHLAVREQVRAPNVITILDSELAKYVKSPPSESKKSLSKQYLTHPTMGANADTHHGFSSSKAPPERAPVEAVPEPVPEPEPAQAPSGAVVEACEPARVVEAVKPTPPPLREPDVWDRILARAGLTPRGCHPVAEPGAG